MDDQIEYKSPRELVLASDDLKENLYIEWMSSYPNIGYLPHPRQIAYQQSQMQLLRSGQLTNPYQGGFPPGGLEGLAKHMSYVDSMLELGRPDLARQMLGFGQTQLSLEQEELLVAEVQLEKLRESSHKVERFDYPPERSGQHNSVRNPGHVEWRHRVIKTWKESTKPQRQGCRYSDLFYSNGMPPCKWGWGKILYEYLWAHDQHAIENDSLKNIQDEYRRRHIREERFQCPALRLEPGVNPEIRCYELIPSQQQTSAHLSRVV